MLPRCGTILDAEGLLPPKLLDLDSYDLLVNSGALQWVGASCAWHDGMQACHVGSSQVMR
jgi:hypothetical protein